MAKQIALLILILVAVTTYAQQTYKFDYVLEYETQFRGKEGDIMAKNYWFINSSDNTTTLLVQENLDKNEVYMKLYTKGGKTYYSSMPRSDFFVEAISLKCPLELHQHELPSLKGLTVARKDTLIDSHRNSYRALTYKRPHGAVAAEHYIMDNSLNLANPALPNNDTAYRFWEKDKDFPAGIVKEWWETDEKNNIILHARLLQYVQLKKIIMVDKNCK